MQKYLFNPSIVEIESMDEQTAFNNGILKSRPLRINEEGYKVVYQSGSTDWMPKSVMDAVVREIPSNTTDKLKISIDVKSGEWEFIDENDKYLNPVSEVAKKENCLTYAMSSPIEPGCLIKTAKEIYDYLYMNNQ